MFSGNRFKLEVNKKNPEMRKQSLKETVEGLFKYYLNEEKGKKELREWAKKKITENLNSLARKGIVPIFQEDLIYYNLTFGGMNRAIMTKIAEDLGYSIRWIRKFTPEKYKMTSMKRELRNSTSAKLEKEKIFTCPFCHKQLKAEFVKNFIEEKVRED